MVARLLASPGTSWARRRDQDRGVAIFVVVASLIASSTTPFVFKIFNDNRVFLGSCLNSSSVCWSVRFWNRWWWCYRWGWSRQCKGNKKGIGCFCCERWRGILKRKGWGWWTVWWWRWDFHVQNCYFSSRLYWSQWRRWCIGVIWSSIWMIASPCISLSIIVMNGTDMVSESHVVLQIHPQVLLF